MIYTFLSCLSTQFVHDIIHESLSTHVFTNILLLKDRRDPVDLIKRLNGKTNDYRKPLVTINGYILTLPSEESKIQQKCANQNACHKHNYIYISYGDKMLCFMILDDNYCSI